MCLSFSFIFGYSQRGILVFCMFQQKYNLGKPFLAARYWSFISTFRLCKILNIYPPCLSKISIIVQNKMPIMHPSSPSHSPNKTTSLISESSPLRENSSSPSKADRKQSDHNNDNRPDNENQNPTITPTEAAAINNRYKLTLSVGLGQFVSICLAGCGVCSNRLADAGLSVPTLQSACNYMALLVFYGLYDEFFGRQRLSLIFGLRKVPARNELVQEDGADFENDINITGRSSSSNDIIDHDSVRIDLTEHPASSSQEQLMERTVFEKTKPLPGWRFLLFAICDVEANYLVVLAYRFTSPASVALLDSFTIPASLCLSIILLKARYRKLHFAAIGLCLCGLGLTLVSDWLRNSNSSSVEDNSGSFTQDSLKWKSTDEESSTTNSETHDSTEKDKISQQNASFLSQFSSTQNAVLGDFIVLAGAALYAGSNVQQEVLLKNGRSKLSEVLSTLGLFGCTISFIQSYLLGEWSTFSTFFKTTGDESTDAAHHAVIPYFVAFQLCMFILYSTVSVFLTHCDAVLFNLSLLTSDVYVVLWQVMMGIEGVTKLYIVSFLVTMCGLIVYYFQPAPTFLGERSSNSNSLEVDGRGAVPGKRGRRRSSENYLIR